MGQKDLWNLDLEFWNFGIGILELVVLSGEQDFSDEIKIRAAIIGKTNKTAGLPIFYGTEFGGSSGVCRIGAGLV